MRNRRRRPVCQPFESLETRQLMHASLANAIPDVTVAPNAPATVIELAATIPDDASTTTVDETTPPRFVNGDNTDGTKVTVVTSQGRFQVNLLDNDAPLTVANFLRYVNSRRYDNVYFHRSVPGFVVQTGGFGLPSIQQHIPTFGTVVNEADVVNRSNVRGTIAMAKQGGDPNSATSEWFVNLADNSQNLNNQNGGFTVFARVPDMTVPDRIASLPTYSIAGNATFEDLPLFNYSSGTIQQSNLVLMHGVSVTNGMTFTATTDNPDLVTPTIVGGRLILAYPGNGQGSANVTVTARTADGQETPITDTFKVTVGTPGSVVVGPNAAKSVQFRDADGTLTTVSVKGPGSATVRFAGNNINQQEGAKKVVTVTGESLIVDDVTLSGANGRTTLVFTTKGGNGQVEVRTINSPSAVGQISGKSVNLTSGISITGGVRQIDLRSASNATISSSGGAVPLTFNAGSVSDTSLTATAGLRSLKTGAWTNTEGSTRETITAQTISQARVTGTFQPSVAVTGLLNNLDVRGAINGGTITAATGGTIRASSIQNATLRFSGNVRQINANAVAGSTIFAGVSASVTTLPSSSGNFQGTATVGTLNIGSLANSNLAARVFSRVNIGSVNTDNGGTAFGIAADRYQSLQFTAGGQRRRVANVDNPVNFTPPNVGDFRVVLV